MTDFNPDEYLALPLPLAELLHVALGPLVNVLEQEGHSWVPLMKKVILAYQSGRDEMMVKKYGLPILAEVDIITYQVSEELVKWVAEMADEQVHFELWKKELGGD